METIISIEKKKMDRKTGMETGIIRNMKARATTNRRIRKDMTKKRATKRKIKQKLSLMIMISLLSVDFFVSI